MTRYMAHQANNLSTPKCRGGKSLPTDIANAVKMFYKSDAANHAREE